MTSRPLRPCLFALGLLGLGCDDGDHEELDEPAPALAGLAVVADEPFSLAAARGRPVLLAFGYTSCAEICPLTLAKMRDVVGLVDGRIDAVYVSVDPERDEPAAFRDYVAQFGAHIEGVFIERPALDGVLDDWHIVAVKQPPPVRRYVGHDVDPARDYAMDHTSSFFLVDRAGRLRVRFASRAAAPAIAAEAKRLLQGAP